MTDPTQALQRMLDMMAGGGDPSASPSSAAISTPPFVAPTSPTAAPRQPTGPMVAPAAPIGAPSKGGIDWKALLQMVAPIVGGLATHGSSQTGFLQGMAHGQEVARQHNAQRQQQDEARRDVGTRYTMGVAEKLSGLEDPTDFAALRDLASKHALTDADRQDIQNIQYSPTKATRTKLKAMGDQLAALDKSTEGGLDALMQSGAYLHQKDGPPILVSEAMKLVGYGAFDASGAPAPKPATIGNTEEERYLAKWAKEQGKTPLTAADELKARGAYRAAGRADPAAHVPAPASVDAQFNDLVDLWKQGHPGREVPAAVRTTLRVQAKKEIGQADDRPVSVKVGGLNALYQATDPKAIAAGIRDGSMPPDISQYGRPVQGAIATELQKGGFNLSTAQTDWKATQKHVAALNSSQQLKLNQSINALPDMLDQVDALASNWKGGRFPILNKANLALARGGAYGPAVASVATQLETQIADVTADLGNVYMGGNSPTDHALALAGKSLKGEWDARVLHDLVRLAKSNVTIRRNSINNTGVGGASAGNPYAPLSTPSRPAVTHRFNPATGKIEPVQ